MISIENETQTLETSSYTNSDFHSVEKYPIAYGWTFHNTLRDAPPLSNYEEVNWEEKYLDIDLELYFALGKLEKIKDIVFPNKCKKSI